MSKHNVTVKCLYFLQALELDSVVARARFGAGSWWPLVYSVFFYAR